MTDLRVTRLAIIASILLQVGCATTSASPALSEPELEVACALARDIEWGPFGNVEWEEDSETIAALERWAAEAEFWVLPATIGCADGRLRLHGKDPNVPFRDFWLADDGRRAAISGGFFGGQLLGGGGTCYYEREGPGWRRVGCVNTWSI